MNDVIGLSAFHADIVNRPAPAQHLPRRVPDLGGNVVERSRQAMPLRAALRVRHRETNGRMDRRESRSQFGKCSAQASRTRRGCIFLRLGMRVRKRKRKRMRMRMRMRMRLRLRLRVQLRLFLRRQGRIPSARESRGIGAGRTGDRRGCQTAGRKNQRDGSCLVLPAPGSPYGRGSSSTVAANGWRFCGLRIEQRRKPRRRRTWVEGCRFQEEDARNLQRRLPWLCRSVGVAERCRGRICAVRQYGDPFRTQYRNGRRIGVERLRRRRPRRCESCLGGQPGSAFCLGGLLV